MQQRIYTAIEIYHDVISKSPVLYMSGVAFANSVRRMQAQQAAIQLQGVSNIKSAEGGDEQNELDKYITRLPVYSVSNGIARIEVRGEIVPTSYETFCSTVYGLDAYAAMIDTAMKDNAVKGVYLNINSGGGSAAGLEQFFDHVQKRSKIKPIETYVEQMVGSAAYYMAASTSRITLNGETTIAGSIGTVLTYFDQREYLERMGIKMFDITATNSPNKRIPNDADTDTIKEIARQSMLDPFNAIFHRDVKKGRAATYDLIAKHTTDINGTVVPTPLTGGIYYGSEALSNGLVDNIILTEAAYTTDFKKRINKK